jgi:glycosyltransferase involved in cell wall biosynthesis
MARVDIVMPLYNKVRTVERAVASIRQQSMEDWRLIVVDDGSTDRSAEPVRTLQDRRIEIITQTNQGPGPARNAGIARADAAYLAFLDADDEWYPWYLANALAAIETEPDVAMVGSMYYEWPKQQDMTRHWAQRDVRAGKYRLKSNDDPEWAESLLLFFNVWNTMVRTEIAGRYNGFYDKKRCIRGEDTTFFMRIGLNENVKIITPPAVRYHREDSDLTQTMDFSLPPLLEDPEEVLRYCSPHTRELGIKVIERLALRTVHHWARNGFKERAKDLLARFPDARRFRKRYYQCRGEIALSRILPYWVRFKCTVGPPTRLFLKTLAWKLHFAPKIPDVNTEESVREK